MKKLLLSLAGLALLAVSAHAQLTGTKTIGVEYATLAAAITDLNTQGVGAGGVVFDVPAGYTETAPAGGFAITASGNATDTIVFRKMGAGLNPTFTASAAHTVGALNDAVFKIIGGDYITLDGFTLQENSANVVNTPAGSNTMTEWGVALLYASLTNGAQNNTIQNCTITLNRTYLNTFGIYSNTRHSATTVATSAEVTAASGSNSNNRVYANTISNVNYGIVFIGAGTTIAAIDSGNDIGGASAATGNTITNWGGGAALSGYISLTGSSYCIFVNQQINDNVSFNTITSAALTQSNTCGGILKNYSIAQPTGTISTTINNNTVTVTNNPTATTSGAVIGINNQGLTPLLSTATMSISNNTVQNCVLGGSTSTTNGISCITNLSLPGTLNMNGNSVINNAISATTATSGIINGISNSGAAGTVNINNNVVRNHASSATSGQPQGITNSGAVVTALNINNNQLGNASGGFFTSSVATSGALFAISSSGGAATCALSIQGNDIRGITYNVAASASQNYIVNTAATLSQNISTNTFTNLNVNTTGSTVFISNNVALPSGGSVTANANSIVTGFNKGGAGGTVTLYLTTTTPSSVAGTVKSAQNNNFSNITLTGSTVMAGWTDLEGATGGGSNKTISGNTFSNWTCGTGAVTALQTNFSGNGSTVSNNTISNISTTAALGGSIIGISLGAGSGGAALACSSNTVTGLSAGSLGQVTGITGGSSSITTMTIANNVISSLSTANSTGTALGLSVTAGATVNVSGNTINTLSGTGNSTAVATGLSVTSGTAVNVFKNKIFDLSQPNSTSSPAVNGMLFSGGTTVTAYNNLIGDLRAAAASSTDAIRGISITSTTTSSAYNVYFNSVNIAATSSGTNFGTAGIFHTASATATTAVLNLRNNLIVNNSTAAGTGLTVAYRRSSGAAGTLANYAAASNNNDFYAGVPSATNLIYTDGTSSAQTMAAYKAGAFTAGNIAPRDSVSFSENPAFLSIAGANVNFLHIDPTIATQLESGGVAVAGITDDFDGNTRNGSTPDVGADEFNGVGIDLSPPSIVYSPLGNGLPSLNQTLTATITDASGVPTAGAGLPTLYYRVNAGAYTPVTGTSIGGNQYTFTFGAAAMTAGDVVGYYIVAQDNAGTPNIIAQPSGGAGGYSANPPAAATAPTTPSSYAVVGAFFGSKTIGAGGDYATLGAGIAALAGGVVTGPVTLTLTDPTYAETYPIVIPPLAGVSSTNTVTIKPATGVSTSFTGTVGADCVLTLNAADWIVVDGSNTVGGTTRDLTFVSANTGTAAVLCLKSNGADGATNNVVKNVNVTGTGPTGTIYGILAAGATVGTIAAPVLGNGNNSNTIQNNNISKVQVGVTTYGASAAAKNTGTIISKNQIATASPNNVGRGGVLAAFENGILIEGNNIAAVGGSTTYAWGISLGLTSLTTTTSTGSEVTNATVRGNFLTSLRAANTFGLGGIQVASAASGNTLIVNNSIADVNTNGTSSDIGAGIFIGGGAGTTQIYYNSISMTGTFTTGTFGSFGVAIGGNNPVVDLRNNIFSSTGSTGANLNRAIGLAYTTFSNLISDYNDLFVSGTGAAVGQTGTLSNTGGTISTTLANWQTNTGKDANSRGTDPLFNSLTSLQPQLGSLALAAGTPIVSIATDIAGNTRSATTPSIGAYELGADTVGPVIAYTPLGNTVSTSSRTLSFTVSDISGVPTSGGGLPVIYYRKGLTGTIFSSQATFVSGNSYDALIDYAPLGVVAVGDVIQYYVAAQDSLGNVSVFPSAGAGGLTANPPASATPPTTPSSYRISALVAGSYNVGAGETYTSLTNPGGFFEFVNSNVVGGNVTVNITSDLTGETGANALNEWAETGGSGFTVTIRPSGAPRSITGAATGALINFNGADRVTLDGSQTGATAAALVGGDDSIRELTITNTSTSVTAGVVNFGAGATSGTNNTIRNVKISGQSQTTTLAGISAGTSAVNTNGSNNGLTVENCSVRRTINGIIATGASAAAPNTGNTITKNDLAGTGTDSVLRIGILVRNQNGVAISLNNVANLSTAESFDAIGIAVGTVAIDATAVAAGGVTNSSVTRNRIQGVNSSSLTGFSAVGIAVAGDATGANVIANNTIAGITAPATSPDLVAGIWISGVTGSVTRVYSNSVSLSGDRGSVTSQMPSFGIAITGVDPTVELKNNIFATTQVAVGGGANAKSYAIGMVSTTFANLDSNYNVFYSAGANAGFFRSGSLGAGAGTDYATLALWQAAVSDDANSIFGDPLFLSPTDLHLTAASPAANAGTVIAAVTTDIDGQPRSAIRPDIGADELAPSANAANLLISAGTLTPSFLTGTLNYTDQVANSVTDVTVTSTAADTNALIEVQVNGGSYATVASGSPSVNLPLNVGANTIIVRLTGEFGSPVVAYTITVTRFAVLTAATLNYNVPQGYPLTITHADIVAAATFTGGFTPTVLNAGPTSANGGVIGFSAGVSVTYNVPAPVFTGADSFSYTLTNSLGQNVSGTINLTVVAPTFPPRPGSITKLPGGAFSSTYSGAVPGLSYRVQYSTDLFPSVFVDLLDGGGAPIRVTADSSGNISFSDAASSGSKGFYRLFGDTN